MVTNCVFWCFPVNIAIKKFSHKKVRTRDANKWDVIGATKSFVLVSTTTTSISPQIWFTLSNGGSSGLFDHVRSSKTKIKMGGITPALNYTKNKKKKNSAQQITAWDECKGKRLLLKAFAAHGVFHLPLLDDEDFKNGWRALIRASACSQKLDIRPHTCKPS